MSDQRTKLARSLAEIDQLLAELEAIAEDPKDDQAARKQLPRNTLLAQ